MEKLAKPILYSYFRSSCSWRVRIVLAWKHIDYEYKAINLAKGEQLLEDFTKVNPLQEVPVFVDTSAITLTNSIPIVEYLEETRPDHPLLPKDPVLRAKVRAVTECIASGIQPLQNLRILKYIEGEKRTVWPKHWIEHGFQGLEKLLEPIHGKCCVKEDITLADAFLVPQVYNANRFNVDMSQFPIISKVHDYLVTLDAFQSTHPSKMPDCPENLSADLQKNKF